MGRPLAWLLAFAFLAPAVAGAEPARGPLPASTPRRQRVAVMDIRALGSEPHLAALLSEVALTETSNLARFEVIGRSDVEALLGYEKQKALLGCSEDSSCLADLAGALGADLLLLGSLGKVGALHRIDLKLVEARRARVVARFGEAVEGSERLMAVVQRGVRQVFAALAGAVPPVPVPLPPPPLRATATPRTGDEGISRRTWGWTALGAGAAAGTAGLVLGLQARSAYSREKAAGARGDAAAYQAARSQVRSASLAADACFVAGAAGAGLGAYLLLSGRPTAVAVVPSGDGAIALLGGTF